MNSKTIIILAGIMGALAVAIGAFGAHGLSEILIANGRLDTFDTAVKYHFYHTLAILIIGLLIEKHNHRLFFMAAYSMFSGIIIFSGSLYILSITNITFLGAITPFGGLLFILGWVLMIAGAMKSKIPV